MFSEGLKCYTCVSSISWDDCEKQVIIRECPKIGDEVCVKEHLKRREGGQVNNNNNEQDENKIPFSKYCSKAEACTNKHCLKDGNTCDLHCCHDDLCNAAKMISSWRTAIAVCVLFASIFYFI